MTEHVPPGDTEDDASHEAEANGYQTEWPTEAAPSARKDRSPFSFFRELPVLIVIAFGLALLMKTFLVQAFFIPSESMEPTLYGHVEPATQKKHNDRVLVNKLAYRFREPHRGEIVVFIAHRDEEKKTFLQKVRGFLFEGLGVTVPKETDFIKRVIGLPGETIQVTDKGVFITPPKGKRFKLSEPYIKRTPDFPTSDNRVCGRAKDCAQGPEHPPTKVKPDTYFVMGDNRQNSSDSRTQLGAVKRADIIGKAFVKIWPPRRMALIEKPEYCSDPRVRCPGETKKAVVPAAAALPLLLLAAGALRRRRRTT